MKFRPCIDLHVGAVKQIVGSSLKDGEQPRTNFVSDLPASHYAALYKKGNKSTPSAILTWLDGLYGGHVISLGDGNEEAALSALRTFPGGMHVRAQCLGHR